MSEEFLSDMEGYFDSLYNEEPEDEAFQNNEHVEVIKSNTQSNLDLFYAKLEAEGLNLDELKGILECKDTLLVLSGAGAGKTTMLILKIIRDLLAGDTMKVTEVNGVHGVNKVVMPANILVSTFLKSGAEELQASFRDWCKRLGITGVDYSTIKFRTIHAEVRDALMQMGVRVDILDNSTDLLRKVMHRYNVKSVQSNSRGITADDISDVASIISYARNRLDDKKYSHSLMDEYALNTLVLDALLKDYAELRAATGKLDFEDMQELILQGAKTNPNVAQFLANRYDYIYVDEFQDTSQLQYEVLKYYFNGAKRVLVIGDDRQCIYSWRGSDVNIISNRFEEDFNPTIKQLTTNYRCKQNILNAVIPSIEKNTTKHPMKLRASKEGGQVNIIYDNDVNHLLESIKQDLIDNRKIGVIARTNADLLIPAILLELDNTVDFALSKSVSLNNRLPRQVFGIMDLVTKRLTNEFEGYLKLFLPRYAQYEAEKIDSILRLNKDKNLYNIPIEDIQYSTPNLAYFIKGLRSAKEQDDVIAYLYILGVLEKRVYVGKTVYAQRAREFIRYITKIILEHKSVKKLSLFQIDTLFNEVLPERIARRIKYGKGTFLKLTTVHDAKGKEWDSVYIWNDIRGNFPNVVGNRALTQEEFEEERRVHYIAWTRAKDKLTVYTQTNCEGTFLKECDLSVPDVIVSSNEDSKTDFKLVRRSKQENEASEDRVGADTLLRSYVNDMLLGGKITDSKVANIEIVLNKYDFESLVERLDSEYGTSIDDTNYKDYFEDFFSRLADEVFNEGLV